MRKLLSRLQYNKIFWSLLGLSLLFFLLRLPSVIEPNWYGDEGIYQVIGMGLDHGRQLYTQAWDNKPPLLYVTYALLGSDQFSVRFASLLFGIGALISLFFLAQKLFTSNRATLIASLLFTILFATPFLEGNIANAENFMLLPITLAGLLVSTSSLRVKRSNPEIATATSWLRNDKIKLFFAGLLVGMAFLFKVVAIFDFAAFAFFLFFEQTRNISFTTIKSVFQIRLNSILAMKKLLVGFLLPITVAVIYFFVGHALTPFIRAAFLGNVSYVGYSNAFIIPQGLLITKLVILALFLGFIFMKRKMLPSPVLFILVWFGFSLFNALFSGRPYPHYLLVLVPSFCLLVGLLFDMQNKKMRAMLAGFFLIAALIVISIFQPHGFNKTVAYYPNAFSFLTGSESVETYQKFFDSKTPRDYMLASFIRKNTTQNDNIFIWGDSAQIYTLANKLPPGRYTVAYHILQNQQAIDETQKDIVKAQPKYIILLPESTPFPFSGAQYVPAFSIQGATIYEKTF